MFDIYICRDEKLYFKRSADFETSATVAAENYSIDNNEEVHVHKDGKFYFRIKPGSKNRVFR